MYVNQMQFSISWVHMHVRVYSLLIVHVHVLPYIQILDSTESASFACNAPSIESVEGTPLFYRMVYFLRISRKSSTFYRGRKFLNDTEYMQL